MKRALLLIVGMTFALFASTAQAQERALSDTVNRILERADMDIALAKEDSFVLDVIESAVPELFAEELTTIGLRIDTRYSLIEQQRGLDDQTSCFRHDQWRIEQKMEEVKEEIDTAREEDGEISTVFYLAEVYGYLAKELEELINGGRNPEREDAVWNILLDVEQGTEFAEEPEEEFCLFNSDYLPPSSPPEEPKIFGCTAALLRTVNERLPQTAGPLKRAIEREIAAAEFAEQWTLGEREISDAINGYFASIESIITSNRPSTRPQAISQRQHETLSGCIARLPDGMLLQDRRGKFSVTPRHLQPLQAFQTLWKNEAGNRPPPHIFRDVEEYLRIPAAADIDNVQEAAVDFAGKESVMFAIGADPGLSLEDDFRPFREAVAHLTVLGNSLTEGMRAFARDFGQYLWQTCLGRPGEAIVTALLKVTFNDECFPYGNGKYLQSTRSNPQRDKCLNGILTPSGEPVPSAL